jgi:class 3 adenylate cyclase
MVQLPTGTVTFMFTDIEGSTRLLQGLGAHYLDVLEAHQRLVRKEIAASDGVEVSTEGDSFFCVFPTAVGAVATSDRARTVLNWEPQITDLDAIIQSAWNWESRVGR